MQTLTNTRHFSSFDRWLSCFDRGLKAILNVNSANSSRSNPAKEIPDLVLDETERKKSAGLMRVNHTGEICAQALYQGQSLAMRNQRTCETLLQAAAEEIDHLIWCQQRLRELNSHTSYLNFFWYTGSFLMGTLVGLFPNETNLGFVIETEQQVSAHLKKHLEILPSKDLRSRGILEQMLIDEQQHATYALKAGGKALPISIGRMMKITSKIMTKTAYFV